MASDVAESTVHFVGRTTRFDAATNQVDLVTNGSFTGNATGWDFNLDNAQPAYSSNAVAWDGTQAGVCSIQPTTPILAVGVTYAIKYTITRSAGTFTVKCGSGTSGTGRTAAGNYVEYLVCSGSTDLILEGDATFVGTVDDVVVYTWVGDVLPGGGCTVATFSGTVSDYMDTDGSPLIDMTGATYSNGTTNVNKTGVGAGVIAGTLAYVTGTNITTGVYEITAVTDDDNVVLADITASGDNADTAITIGGAYSNVQAAFDDDSTDVVDGGGNFHHRYVCTNVDETTAVTIAPDGGDRGSSKFFHVVGYHSVLALASEDAADDRVISDMDVDSFHGEFAASFITSYYMGAIECIREVESAVRKRPDGDQVKWDADDNAIDVVTVAGDNTEIRNVYAFNTDKTTDGSDCVTAAAAREGTVFINCRFDDTDDLIDGGNLDESVFLDCYFGANIGNTFASYLGMISTLYKSCVFNGSGLSYSMTFLDDSTMIGCLHYKGTEGLFIEQGASRVLNNVFYDQPTRCVFISGNDTIGVLYNNIFSPEAATSNDQAVTLSSGNGGTASGSNNIAYSVTAASVLAVVYTDANVSLDFWLPETVEEDPAFVDAANFDFRLSVGSPAEGSGIGGFDPGDGVNIGLDCEKREAVPG